MRLLQRTIALLSLIALGVWLFYIGREHQVFLDNRSMEVDGRSFKALEQVNVSVNGANPLELYPRDRDMAKAVGPSFTVKVEVLDSMGGDVVRTIETKVDMGFGRDVMLSLPLMAADQDFLLPPPGVHAPATEEPAPSTGEEIVPGAGAEPGLEVSPDAAAPVAP